MEKLHEIENKKHRLYKSNYIELMNKADDLIERLKCNGKVISW